MLENLKITTDSLKNVDVKTIKSLLDDRGYVIISVTSWIELVKRLKSELITKLGPSVEFREGISWKPYLGMANFQGYSDNSFNKIYRLFNFKWNPCENECIINTIDEMERFKNSLLYSKGEPVDYDYYYSASFYPSDGGFMSAHSDGIPDSSSPLIHVLMPITFKGADYIEGGQYIYSNGKKIDTENGLQAGDIIIYNGALMHGVDPVNGGVGRIQIFGVPVKFQSPEDNIEFLRALPIRKLIRPKLLALKNSVYSILGKGFIRN